MPYLIQLFFEKFLREIRNSIEIFPRNNLIRQGLKQAYKVALTFIYYLFI